MRLVILLLIISSIFSCNRNKVTVREFYEEINEEPYKLTEIRSDFGYELRYIPADFLALKDFSEESVEAGKIKSEDFINLRNKYKSGRRFQLTVYKTDGSDFVRESVKTVEEYKLKQEIFQNQMQNDLFMITSDKKVYPVSYQYTNTYGASPALTFTFVFPSDLPEEIKLVFTDRITAYPEIREIGFLFNLTQVSKEFLFEELI